MGLTDVSILALFMPEVTLDVILDVDTVCLAFEVCWLFFAVLLQPESNSKEEHIAVVSTVFVRVIFIILSLMMILDD